MKKLGIIILMAIILVLSINSAFALCGGSADFFYGTLKINGADAPVGTQVRAILSGEIRGTKTAAVIGQYGTYEDDADKLYVQGAGNGSDFNGIIRFEVYVNNQWVDSGETSIYDCGGFPQNPKNLNIDVTTSDPNDVDNDGDTYTENQGDCNDNNPNVYPGAAEACNGIDDDCDQSTDEGVQTTFYQDSDVDNYGNAAVSQLACSQPSGYVANNADCNDNDINVNPGAEEQCDGVDNDCNAQTGDGFDEPDLGSQTFCGIGACTSTGVVECANGALQDTCQAGQPALNDAVCNNIDDDCDSDVDEDYSPVSCGTGACEAQSICGANGQESCTEGQPSAETCNGIDDNCDQSIDEGLLTIFYNDLDVDTYGNAQLSQLACLQPSGYVTDSTDCDDSNPAVNPAAAEIICDGIDNDCSGGDNTGTDGDEDTYKTDGGLCGAVDCNDNDANINPGAAEVCDQIDNDCDSEVDEGNVCGGCTDSDGDTVCDETDVCPGFDDRIDTDFDLTPDGCDTDDDDDGVLDVNDNCPLIPTSEQTDTDGDGQGNACDDNDDNDEAPDASDNCPLISNSNQLDTDNDGLGDVCDDDDDGDDVLDVNDNCPLTSTSDQTDTDNDGLGDVCDDDDDEDGVLDVNDNCPLTSTSDQTDTDNDGLGDACDDDDDNDTKLDDADNCPIIVNTDQTNSDGDSLGDVCDLCPNDANNDADFDSYCGNVDNCPVDYNPDQQDLDNNGIGSACEQENVTKYNTSITIYNGWTLFALPFKPIGISNSEQLGQAIINTGVQCEVIVRFNGQTQQTESDILGLADAFALSGTEGYFINCNAQTTFTYEGISWA